MGRNRKHLEPNSRHGKLTVLFALPDVPGKTSSSMCQCDCGKVVTVLDSCVRHGNIVSCGCARGRGPKKKGLARVRAKELRSQGLSMGAIAQMLGVTKARIQQLVPGRLPPKIIDLTEARDLAARGWSRRRVSKALGIPMSVLNKDAGMKIDQQITFRDRWMGRRSGRLTVIDRISCKRIVVQCDCGSPAKEIISGNFKRTKSCGCLRKEHAQFIGTHKGQFVKRVGCGTTERC